MIYSVPLIIHRSITSQGSCKEQRWNQLLYWFSFLMAFPSLLFLGQNASVYVFAVIVLFIIGNSRFPLIGFTKLTQLLALFFALGAIISVFNIPYDSQSNALNRALAVLPNYLYWSLLIIVMVQQHRFINFEIVYKAVFWGVICTVIYYLLIQQYVGQLAIFNNLTPNTFAFVLICYAPFAIQYIKDQKNRLWAFVFLMILIIVLLMEGRRAGMVLVLLGGLSVLYADRFTIKRFITIAVTIPILLTVLYTSVVESVIMNSNERIHELIYETGDISTTDRSYLTRIAMINKGLAIYDKYPYTGIGLNNFTNYSTAFDESFEGSIYVINKDGIQEKSAHNSYISLLAEGGLILLVPFILLLTLIILSFLFKINNIRKLIPIYSGIIGMSIHLYFISAIVNVFAWFLIGLGCVAIYRK